MAIENAELNRMQGKYQAAVEDWIAAIRKEEVLASAAVHSETEIDLWGLLRGGSCPREGEGCQEGL
jgi:hypothetical protein